jgi:phospholipid/cholesterol/gamma-HCH transport system substrate-binding protein
VGKVKTIAIDPDDTRLIRVDVSVLKTTPIKTDTMASLKLTGVTGGVFVELSGSSPQAPDLPGATGKKDIPEIPAEPSSIDAIINAAPEILRKVSLIADQVNKLLSDENVASVSTVLADWKEVSAGLARQTSKLDTLLQTSNGVADDLHKMIGNSQHFIHELTANLKDTSAKLNKLIASTNESAGGQLQQLSQLLTELKKTTRDVDQLANHLKDNPSGLLFPTKEKGVPAP